MQMEMFEFTREVVPLDVILDLKNGDKISMMIGSMDDYKEDIFLENVEFHRAYELCSHSIDPENLKDVYVKIKFNERRHEVSVPVLIIKEIHKIEQDMQ